ncbi:helix-turn-helix domain-containing protein [Shewanella surugensis]|uniref:Helix-turn-helix domain-containing protein n=1 Tax=Shewanella surugensis TaxID=212020 RepID=A0ABT0L6W6_9GAMM|nr:helix-turn-helix domain-containing protein [Shewanella surugensis]MCL1123416.1 helix-turn-helix domain-containing protein [Shewanella surugensis]
MTLNDYYYGLSLKGKVTWLKQSAKALDKSERTIRAYIQGTRRIQAGDVTKFVELTEQCVSAHNFRPDIFPKPAIKTDKKAAI